MSPALLPLLVLVLLLPPPVRACTTIAVGRLATADGSVLASHSNDGEGDTDPRLVRIPASDWPPGALRNVYYSPESVPRYVGSDRTNGTSVVAAYAPGGGFGGDGEEAEPGKGNGPAFRPLEGCAIPQVRRTYQYYEQTYGALNEKQLGIAESTCSGVFGAGPLGSIVGDGVGDGSVNLVGKACFSVDALTQIAMERHSTARAAILEMGELAVSKGFYGAGFFEGGAESLLVTDVDEAWVFHILPDPTGESAIWAARKVPDDHFAVVPNAFIIRELHPEDSDNYLFSQSAHDVAADLGWWDPNSGDALDFTAAYSDGEYANKYYSGRRSWGVYTQFAPSLDLPAEYEEWRISKPYPFSAKPDRLLGVSDVADAMRSYYEGTHYSQAGDATPARWAGGPWGSPDHVAGRNDGPSPTPSDGDDSDSSGPGNWERTIGLYRTSDSYVAQSRKWLPDAVGGVLWYAPYAAPYSVYVPFAAGMEELPTLTLGTHMTLDKATLYWAFRFLGNYAQMKWTHIMNDEVRPFQRRLMEESLDVQRRVDNLVVAAVAADETDSVAVAEALKLYANNADRILGEAWALNDHIMFRYADGQIHGTIRPGGGGGDGRTVPAISPRRYDAAGFTTQEPDVVDQPGYPTEWLEAVGFFDGPERPPNCEELGWRCGHAPSSSLAKEGGGMEGGGAESSSSAGKLRGDAPPGVAANRRGRNLAATRSLYEDFDRRKGMARESNSSTCGAVGDVAAAVRSCSKQ